MKKDDGLDIPDFLKRDKNAPLPDWKPRAPEKIKSRVEADAATVVAFEKNEAKRKPKQKQRGKEFDPTTHRWDTIYNRWVPLCIYRKESKMRPDFMSMDLVLLRQAYNEMAVAAVGFGLPVTAVRKFLSKDSAIRRCEALYKKICEAKGEVYEEPANLPEVKPDEFDEIEHPVNDVNIAKLKPSKAQRMAKVVAVAGGAKKATKKAAKKKTIKKAPSAPEKDKLPITAALGLRTDSLMEKIAIFLSAKERIGKQVLEKIIIRHLYGDDRKSNRVEVLMKVMRKDKYELRKEVKDGVVSYGLYAKK